MKLSILMPVYNEVSTVEDILDRVLAAPLPSGMTREVIVVDDQSTDRTPAILEAYAATHPEVVLRTHTCNKGKGAAIRTAIECATGDIGIIQDSDLEYDPRDYERLLCPILEHDADVVYGSRFASAEYRRVLFFWHSFANRLLTCLSNMLTDLNLTDMETCYKAFRMSVLKTIPIRSNRFGIEPELTAKFAKRGLRIFEVPIRYDGRTYQEGKKIGLKDAIEAVWVMIKYKFIDDIYAGKYGEATLGSMELARSFTIWLFDVLQPFLGPSVLEVGAGIGNNVRAMLNRKLVIATEMDAEYVRGLRIFSVGRKRVKVAQWDVSEPFAGDLPPVDTVLCSNVLEHIEDESSALRNMRDRLRPQGRLVLVVPAGSRLYGTVDEAIGHIRRYDSTGLCETLAANGYTVEQCISMNKMGVLGWYMNGRILRRRALGRAQLRLFNMLVPLFRRMDRFLPWQGLSLVAVARRVDTYKSS